MGRSSFTRVLLLSILLLVFSNGFGRKLAGASANEEHSLIGDSAQEKSRVAFELDYVYAGPNVNGRSGFVSDSPSPSLPPPASPVPEFGH